jgi:hypothetical protein
VRESLAEQKQARAAAAAAARSRRRRKARTRARTRTRREDMAAARVSIPAAVRRTIQNIKEIAGGHTDEEVYAVLRECNMDPNETTDRLLNQGTFHEVRRKRDKKKESAKESADARWRPGMQGRGGKGGWGNSSRQLSNSSGMHGICLQKWKCSIKPILHVASVL